MLVLVPFTDNGQNNSLSLFVWFKSKAKNVLGGEVKVFIKATLRKISGYMLLRRRAAKKTQQLAILAKPQ